MAEIPAELDSYRRTIDNLDAALVHILAERFRCTQQVGVLKAERDLPASDPLREERQIARLRELAVQSGLDPVFAEKFLMEEELLERINKIGIGPGGLGGSTTALAVNVNTYPTHIAGLPVAVNICCHVNRHVIRTI